MSKCINAKSTLYSTLEKLNFTTDEIADVTIKLFSKEFESWYGKSKRDSFEQPELKDGLYLINDKGEKITIIELKNSKDWSDLEEIFKNEGELEKLSNTLEVLKTGLLKRLSKYKHSTGQSKQDLQDIISEIEKYESADTAIALTKYTEYVSKVFGSLKAGLINIDSIDNLKLSDLELKKYEDKVIELLLQANAFLKGFESIEKLDEFNNLAPGIGLTLKVLKDLQTEMKFQEHEIEKRLKKEIVKHFKNLSSNPEILQGVVDFMASTTDNNLKQTWLDSLGDSQNPIFTSVDKLYKRTLEKAKKEIKTTTRKWKNIQKKYNLKSEEDFKKLLNSETNKFLEEYDVDSFNEKKNYFNNKLQYFRQTGKAFDEDGDNTDEYAALLKERKIFLKENAIKLNNGDFVKYVPNQKYKNEQYAKLTQLQKDSIKDIKSFLEDLTSHTDSEYFKKGNIPAFGNHKLSKSTEKSDEEIISEEGNIIKFLSLSYVNKLNQEKLPELGTKYDEELFNKRQEIIAKNLKEHGKAISTNLGSSIELFIQSAVTHKYKKTIENKIKLVNENLKFLKVIETNARGNKIIDKISGEVHEKDFKESNLYKQWKGWVEGVFYEDFMLDEGKLSEYTNKLTNATSFLGIGFNVLSAINNKITGNIQLKIEAAGKQYFDAKEYGQARWLYFKNINNFIANMDKDTSSTLIEAFIKDFEIYQDKSELVNTSGGFLNTAKEKAKWIKDKSFFMQKIGEHQIQNTSLIAMLQSHRIVNGKIVSFFDFVNNHEISAEVKKMQENRESVEKIKIYISENKLDKKELRKQFDKNQSILDSFDLIDGHLELKKDSNLDENEIFDFKEKVRAVNQKLHGAYNNEDAALMQRYALGRLAMQFRKWLPNSWNRRFGAKFGKSYWNERRKEYNTGMYISFGKFVASPFIKSFEDYKKQEQKNALEAFKMVLNGFKESTLNAKIHWHSLTELEKANVRRTGMEFSLLLAAIISAYILKGMGDDDDESLALAWALQQANRSYSELSTFNFGLLTEGKNLMKTPFATFRTLDGLTKLGYDVLAYPFRNDNQREFNTGIYNNHSKIKIRAAKIFFPPYIQIGFLKEKNDKYGLKW